MSFVLRMASQQDIVEVFGFPYASSTPLPLPFPPLPARASAVSWVLASSRKRSIGSEADISDAECRGSASFHNECG